MEYKCKRRHGVIINLEMQIGVIINFEMQIEVTINFHIAYTSSIQCENYCIGELPQFNLWVFRHALFVRLSAYTHLLLIPLALALGIIVFTIIIWPVVLRSILLLWIQCQFHTLIHNRIQYKCCNPDNPKILKTIKSTNFEWDMRFYFLYI